MNNFTFILWNIMLLLVLTNFPLLLRKLCSFEKCVSFLHCLCFFLVSSFLPHPGQALSGSSAFPPYRCAGQCPRPLRTEARRCRGHGGRRCGSGWAAGSLTVSASNSKDVLSSPALDVCLGVSLSQSIPQSLVSAGSAAGVTG